MTPLPTIAWPWPTDTYSMLDSDTSAWPNNTGVELIDYTRVETDPNGLDLNSPGAKADSGKNRVWLFMAGFSRALEEVSKVTTIGAGKYTPNGWVDVPDGQTRYMDAFGRHMLKFGTGELMDDGEGGTGCYHQAQMIWNLLAAFELQLRENDS